MRLISIGSVQQYYLVHHRHYDSYRAVRPRRCTSTVISPGSHSVSEQHEGVYAWSGTPSHAMRMILTGHLHLRSSFTDANTTVLVIGPTAVCGWVVRPQDKIIKNAGFQNPTSTWGCDWGITSLRQNGLPTLPALAVGPMDSSIRSSLVIAMADANSVIH
jgi:hypothetical protein